MNENTTMNGTASNTANNTAKLEAIRASLPDYAKDIKINLQTVLQAESLSASQRWGVALASAAAVENRTLLEALSEAAGVELDATAHAAVKDDAFAAATLMGMNNVFYRFRHMVGRPEYEKIPARLRMQRLIQPATNKLDFELACLVVSAITGCESCVQAHEKVVIAGGLTEQQVHDAIRIGATVVAASRALALSGA